MWAGIIVIVLLVTIICITLVKSTKKLKESVAQFTRSTVPESLVSIKLLTYQTILLTRFQQLKFNKLFI